MSLAGKNMAGKLGVLRSITNNFSSDVLIGRGGYADVYRAILDGKEIAVKKFRQLDGRVHDKEFANEVLNLKEIEHENIVRLLDYCYVKETTYDEQHGVVPIEVEHVHRVLWFEYMQGGSLHQYISADEPCYLDWPRCYKIIRGVCEGLKHLHTRNGKPIYHRDLHTANILLDKNMTAKIGDLGLSELVESTETHITMTVRPTGDHMPPEYRKERKISNKFDVFSLGFAIIQMLAGTNYNAYLSQSLITAKEFTKLVTEKWKERLQATFGHLSQETAILQADTAILQVKTCVDIALRCVKYDRKDRPEIKDIVIELEKVEAPEMLASDSQSSDSNVIAIDPAELRFLFEPRKKISCCLQLRNMTSDYIAFNIKIDNPSKYNTVPSRGIMKPCSMQYVSVTLQAQDALQNMPCQDKLHVQSVNLGKKPTWSDVEINEDFFEKVIRGKVVVPRPIVLVAEEQLRAYTSMKALNLGSAPMDTS